MTNQKAASIKLSVETAEVLQKLVKGHTTYQQIAKRARIIELVAAGNDDKTIAQAVRVNRHTVRHWRRRWLRLEALAFSELSVEERLADLPRPGAPEKRGRPISQWTSRELAAEIIQQKIVDTISPRHAARLLKRSRDSPASKSLLAEWTQR